MANNKIQIPIKELYNKLVNMTGKDVFGFMLKALDSPKTIIELDTEGYTYKNKSYGGAGVNTICEIMHIEDVSKHLSWGLPKKELETSFIKPMYSGLQVEHLYGDDWKILQYFTFAVNALSRGNISQYNFWCELYNLKHLTLKNETNLPRLTDDNYKSQLTEYKEYYNKYLL